MITRILLKTMLLKRMWENSWGWQTLWKLWEKRNPFLDFIDENKSWQPGMILMMYGTHKVELVKNVKNNIFDLIDENSYNHTEYWLVVSLKRSWEGVFQINARNVRNRQFVEDILVNTTGRSMRMVKVWDHGLQSKSCEFNEKY